MAAEGLSIARHWSMMARPKEKRPALTEPPAAASTGASVVATELPTPPSPSRPTVTPDANPDIREDIARLALGTTPDGAAAPAPEPARAVLERTVCFGFCPAYTVTIAADGTVTYVGKDFVRVHGKQVRHIDPRKAAGVLAHFRRASFFGMQSSYRVMITDNPTATLTLTMGGRTKTVEDYPPCHGGSGDFGVATPSELCALEQEMDDVAGTASWTECHNDSGRPYCER
jgi:hypothetical protein